MVMGNGLLAKRKVKEAQHIRLALKIKGNISEDYHQKFSSLKETAIRPLVSTDCNLLLVLKAQTLFLTLVFQVKLKLNDTICFQFRHLRLF